MSAIAFGIPVRFDRAHVEGIVDLQAADIAYAEQLGYRIKLLAITKRRDDLATGGIELRVHPTLVPSARLIANVEGAMNAVLVKGDAVGPTLYYGAGAGAEPTASAVIADLVDVTRMENELLELWSANRKSVLFITHDLEEAIALSDRVVVLSAGPATRPIGEFPIDLPRPRDVAEIRLSPRFVKLHEAIWHVLKSEVLKGYAQGKR